MAVLILLLVSVIWGSTFSAQKIAMDHMGPLAYTGIRFALGGLLLLPIGLAMRSGTGRIPERAGAPGEALKAVLLAGSALFGGAVLQQAGMVYTTAGKAGFITGLYVVIVPLYLIARGDRLAWGEVAGVVLAVAGMYFLCIHDGFTLVRGDALVLCSAFVWAAHLLILAIYAPRVETFIFASGQFLVCAALSLVSAAVFEPVTASGVVAAIPAILYGGVVSVGVAYTLQIHAQKKAPPTVVAVVLSLETVFAAVFGFLVLGERMGARELAGAALMFAGMLCAQMGQKK